MMLLNSPPIFAVSSASSSNSNNSLFAQVVGSILLCPPDSIDLMLPMIPPLPQSLEDFKQRNIVNQILEECFIEQPNAGYEIQPTDEWIVNSAVGGTNNLFTPPIPVTDEDSVKDSNKATRMLTIPILSPSTYGEVTSLGARQLFDRMGILKNERTKATTTKKQDDDDDVVFMDMGSGAGKLVLQAFLEIPSIRQAIGIELAPSRHEAAINAKERLHEMLYSFSQTSSPSLSSVNEEDVYQFWLQRMKQQIATTTMGDDKDVSILPSLQFYQDDILNADLSNVSHIYVASLCFPTILMEKLERRITETLQQNRQQQQSKTSSKLRCIASIQKFPTMTYSRVEYIEMSWTKPKGSKVYFYDI